MVAYTSPDCLPYLEGTDSLCLNTGTVCDPSTVWCDQARIVDAKLTEFDDVVARTAESTPLAWIECSVPVTYTVGVGDEFTPLFDTVRVDTDNMVNLDELSSGLTFRRTGIYAIWGWLAGVTETNFGAGQSIGGSLSLRQVPYANPYGPLVGISSFDTNWEVFVNDVQIMANIHHVVPVTAADQRLIALLDVNGISNDSVTINSVHLGAAWMADLP